MNPNPLQFPVGHYTPIKEPNEQQLKDWIDEIASFPEAVKRLTENATIVQLNWKYRPEGWTVKQVVHHCADSHLNSFIRFKLALTEEKPTIRPYFEDRWAKLPDAQNDQIHDSIKLLEALHAKWTMLLKSLTKVELQREYVHPEHGETFNLAETIGLYAWHCRHHLAHVKQGLDSKGKFNA